MSGVSERMIRHYETIGLMPAAARQGSGYRDYDEKDVHRLRFVARARNLGFAIDDIRQLLSLWDNGDRASADVRALALSHAAALGEKVDALQAMRKELLHLADLCHGDGRPDCPILDRLSG